MKSATPYTRYGRQITLKEFGETGQQKLLQAKVLVIGAGGLGCPALQYLVAAGAGTVGVADDDVVSLSNLHRQVLYSTGDVGLRKVDVAVKKLQQLNPEIALLPYPVRLTNNNALQLIGDYDYIIDGTDNFASRYLINDACALLSKPLVYGAVSQYEGQVAVFNIKDEQGDVVNYRHLFPQPPKQGEVANCAEAGVLGVLPGIIGTMQAAETIKLITGIGEPLVNKLLTYNILTNQLYDLKIKPDVRGTELLPKTADEFLRMVYEEVCAVEKKGIAEINARQFQKFYNNASTVFIDVRERGELPLVTGFTHRQIPMSVFGQQVKGIEEKTVVLFCQHGVRSLYAAELVQGAFGSSKEIYSLKGGLVKWSEELGIS